MSIQKFTSHVIVGCHMHNSITSAVQRVFAISMTKKHTGKNYKQKTEKSLEATYQVRISYGLVMGFIRY